MDTKTPKRLPLKKVYLKPGEHLDLFWTGRVGPTGTIVDLQADGNEMVLNQKSGSEHDIDEGVGEIRRKGYRTPVFLELETGRFWFDDNGWGK